MSTDAGMKSLLESLEAEHGPAEPHAPRAECPHGDAVVGELVYSFLVWEAGVKVAEKAMQRCLLAFADYNELRIAYADELSEVIGPKYRMVEERCERLRAVLNEVWVRECGLRLGRLADLSKRDARQYLAELPGMTPFVAARVSLVALGGHAVPVDGRILQVLCDAGLMGADVGVGPATGKVERMVRAGDGPAAYALLEAAAGVGTKEPTRGKRRAKAG